MKIINVTSLYPPHVGGIERVAEKLAELQSAAGHEVEVVTSNIGQGQVTDFGGIKLTRLRSKILLNTPIIFKLYKHLLKEKNVDLVHLHVAQAFVPEITYLACRRKRIPYVAHFHMDIGSSQHSAYLLKAYKSFILKKVLKSAACVIVLNRSQQKFMSQRYMVDLAKIKIIPNGIDESFVIDYTKRAHNPYRILFSGRLSPQKNVQLLLHALDGISESITTNIVGDGELYNELLRLSKDLDLHNVTFHGSVSKSKMKSLYEKNDLFILPSEREGMPLVLLEAMAMGLPIIGTDISGINEIVRDGENGLLIAADNVGELQNAIIALSMKSDRYSDMSKKSREIAKGYNWQNIYKEIADVYEKILEK